MGQTNPLLAFSRILVRIEYFVSYRDGESVTGVQEAIDMKLPRTIARPARSMALYISRSTSSHDTIPLVASTQKNKLHENMTPAYTMFLKIRSILRWRGLFKIQGTGACYELAVDTQCSRGVLLLNLVKLIASVGTGKNTPSTELQWGNTNNSLNECICAIRDSQQINSLAVI